MRAARVVRWLALVLLGALAWLLLAPLSVGGHTGYVVTHGVSMEPRFHSGDLAVLRSAEDYQVGDVAAYRSDLLKTVVMHRIVAKEQGHYTFKGDNNSWLDPETPSAGQLIGKLALRVPQGGVWLHRATSPAALGVATFALLAGGGTAVHGRRRRRRQMSRHAARTSKSSAWAALPPGLRTAAAGAAGVGILGLALGAFAWTGPTTRTVPSTDLSAQLTFSYTAQVPRSPAYDTTVVHSPSPVFRKLANSVDVQLAYRGSPGSVAVAAVLSTAGGWTSTVPLAPRTAFAGPRYDGTVRLDLPKLEARAQAAAKVTGLAATPLSISVVAQVQTQGRTFAPALGLTASPSALSLAGEPAALAVKDTAAAGATRHVPRVLSLKGRTMTVPTARNLSAGLAAAAVLVLLGLALVGSATSPVTEGAAIRRRWAELLLEVQPVPTPAGRPVVDVTTFETLARLAERYGLLVLHWNRADVDTFVVQDEGTTYRYRTAGAEQPELVTS
ncbi:MAG: hypothetical protein JWN87_1767 [Frankiales bacterium]|nr:hypothetical protein [Frankiales bacterium]